MDDIVPSLVFGSYKSGEWITRYCRFRAELPAGRYRLTGKIFNHKGQDLIGNKLVISVNRVVIGEIDAAFPPAWSAFSLEIPELPEAAKVDITMRTTKYRVPSNSDVRLLGMLLSDLHIEAAPGERN